ncbi:MAG: hypothetical protein KGZ25_08225, partial [Planctomycetes bacterium]|nr:hypothetical protein [Planctomycetota bacterium]
MANSTPLYSGRRIICLMAMIVAVFWGTDRTLGGVESPTSYGEVSQLEAPVFRIPMMEKAPDIDGKFIVGE